MVDKEGIGNKIHTDVWRQHQRAARFEEKIIMKNGMSRLTPPPQQQVTIDGCRAIGSSC